jgi:hypothetical protein
MGTFFRASSTVVKRARSWVMTVAKTICHVVRVIAAIVSMGEGGERETNDNLEAVSRVSHAGEHIPNFFRSNIHLLNMMTDELRPIQTLRRSAWKGMDWGD